MVLTLRLMDECRRLTFFITCNSVGITPRQQKPFSSAHLFDLVSHEKLVSIVDAVLPMIREARIRRELSHAR